MVEVEVKTFLGKNMQKKSKAVLNLESHLKIVSNSWSMSQLVVFSVQPQYN